MDLVFTVIAGLSLRIGFLRSEHPLMRFSPALVGGWEGVVVHQLSSRSDNEMDHLLAYGLRLLVDHYVSGDVSRTVMTVIWTAIGFAASEALTPRSSLQPVYSSSSSYYRRSRSRRRPRTAASLSTLATAPRRRSITPESSSTRLTTPTPIVPKLPQLGSSNRIAKVPVHRPPSPPSTFLQSSELDPASPIIADPLLLSPIKPTDGLVAYREKRDSSSTTTTTTSTASTIDPLLPTPPKSVPSENVANTRDSESPNRLSTIPEITTVDEKTPSRRVSSVRTVSTRPSPRPKQDETQETVIPPAPASQQGNETATPGSPLPVPNLTMKGFSHSTMIPDNEATATPAPSSLPEQNASIAPTPASDPTTPSWHLDHTQGELLSPLSGGGLGFGARDARIPQRTPEVDLLSPLSGGPEFGARHTRGPVPRPSVTDEPLSPIASGLGIDIRPSAPEVRVSRGPPPATQQQDELLSPMDTGPDLSPQAPPSRRGSRSRSSKPSRPPPTDDLLSPMDDMNEFDELRTPPKELRGSTGEISDDPLRTPFQSPDALSPLLFDKPVPQAVYGETRRFGQPSGSGFQPFAAIDSGTDQEYLDAPGSIPGSMPSPPVVLPAAAPAPDPTALLSPRSDATSVLSSTSPTKLNAKAERLRSDARQTEKDLQQARQDYNVAMKQKKFRDALDIKGRIVELEEEVKKLHKSAARRYFVSLNDYNPKRKEDTIDVHGLRPSEALERTERALRETMKAGGSTLRVIVGKGIHSANRQPVLKGHIQTAMDRQKIPCSVDRTNAGVLILSLPPPN